MQFNAKCSYSFSCDSLDKLKQKLPTLEKEIAEVSRFKDFYQFTFSYAKNPGQKSLDLEMALAYWDIVLKDRFRFLDIWCKFLKVSLYFKLHDAEKVFVPISFALYHFFLRYNNCNIFFNALCIAAIRHSRNKNPTKITRNPPTDPKILLRS